VVSQDCSELSNAIGSGPRVPVTVEFQRSHRLRQDDHPPDLVVIGCEQGVRRLATAVTGDDDVAREPTLPARSCSPGAVVSGAMRGL
jgi:hypothetical protein